MRCPECNGESVESRYCYQCRCYRAMVSRDKVRVNSTYKVVDWFSSRSSAGLIVESADGERYPIYMSDVFRHLDGLNLGELTLEETKKGSAYGWCVVEGGEANR